MRKVYLEKESKNIANKIWPIANDWTASIMQKNTKQIMLGLTVHQLSAQINMAGYINMAMQKQLMIFAYRLKTGRELYVQRIVFAMIYRRTSQHIQV